MEAIVVAILNSAICLEVKQRYRITISLDEGPRAIKIRGRFS
jgi:hypothetical protein